MTALSPNQPQYRYSLQPGNWRQSSGARQFVYRHVQREIVYPRRHQGYAGLETCD
jgi:hypothetical protein